MSSDAAAYFTGCVLTMDGGRDNYATTFPPATYIEAGQIQLRATTRGTHAMTERDELVHYSADRGVARIELDSPHNRNALSRQLCAELDAHLLTASEDSSVRAVELTHTGSVFCAGADLSEASSGPAITDVMVGLLRRILDMPKPVVARLTATFVRADWARRRRRRRAGLPQGHLRVSRFASASRPP